MTEKNGTTLVIVDPIESSRNYLRFLTSQWGYLPFCFDRETICLDNLKGMNPALVIHTSPNLDSASRMVHALKMISSALPILVISADTAAGVTLGANGFKGVEVILPDLKPEGIQKRLDDLLASKKPDSSSISSPQIIGNSPVMLKIKRMISELCRSTEPVLVKGGSGTGKEMVARAIHLRSPRMGKPFVKIDCHSISNGPENTGFINLNNTLQNDAYRSIATLGLADAGTLFLREIGLTPPPLQSELLQMTEEGAISNPGFRTKRKVDIRILASTSMDLNLLVQKGWFRKDLFFRLNGFSIDLPTLADRREDIPALMNFFTDQYCTEKETIHIDIAPEGKHLFENYSWPGNVRELEAQVRRVLSGDIRQWKIEGAPLGRPISNLKHLQSVASNIDAYADFSEVKNYLSDMTNLSLKDICNEFTLRVEKRVMKMVLEYTRWNRKKAAGMLDISYKSLLNKIRDYRLGSHLEL